MQKRKIKNTILKTLTFINVLLFIVSATAVDSISNIPRIALLVSAAWLLLFAYANRHSKATVQEVVCGWGE